MHLKIAAPGATLFEGEVSKVTLPTESWEITVLPDHQPLTSVVKAGLISFATTESIWDEYILSDGKVQVAVSKWLVIIDGKTVVVTTSAATTSPAESEEVLLQMKQDMQTELEKIRDDGNAEDIEKALENMAKVEADLKLVKLKKIG